MDNLYEMENGFDRREEAGNNSWNWAIDKNASIKVLNNEKHMIFNISFFLCPPPGKQHNMVTISINDKCVLKVKTPQLCQLSLDMPQGCEKKVEFEIQDGLTHADNGDERGFAFQLVDFKCEPESAYVMKDDLRKMHEIQRDTLQFFINVCEQNQLSYYMFYGSLLGTVRHDGMIPWDDDIDVVMPRADWEKFLKLYKNVKSDKYEISHISLGDNCYYGGYIKFIDKTTTRMVVDNWKHNCKEGIGIDVIPMDFIPEDVVERECILKEITKCQELLFAKIYGNDENGFSRISAEKWKDIKKKAFYQNKKKLLQKLDKLIKKSNEKPSALVTTLGRYLPGDSRIFYDRVSFGKGKILKFEGIDVRVPDNYLKCLEVSYGSNFMVYPKEEFRKTKTWALWDLEREYVFYESKLADVTRLERGRHYVVWGLSDKMKYLLENFSDKYIIDFVVSKEEVLSGKTLFGKIIVDECLFKKIYTENKQILLCSEDVLSDIRDMEYLGIHNYKILVDDFSHMVSLI